MENGAGSAAPEATPQATPPVEVAKITEEDKLRVELAFVKFKYVEAQEKLLQQDLLKVAKDKMELARQLQELQAEFAKKYNIRLGVDTMGPDGAILRGIPMNPQTPKA